MKNNMKKDTPIFIDKLESEIDNYPSTHSIMKEPLPYSVWNLLTAHEYSINSAIVTGAVNSDSLHSILDGAKYALKYSLEWVHKWGKKSIKFSSPKSIHKGRFLSAQDLLLLGKNYQGVVSAFVNYRSGAANAQIIDKLTIKFTMPEDEVRYDVLDNKLVDLKSKKYYQIAIRDTLNSPSGLSKFKKLLDQVYFTSGNVLKVKYNLDDIEWLHQIFRKTVKGTEIIPENWNYHDISIGAFRRVWDAITTISIISSQYHSLIMGKSDVDNNYVNSVIISSKKLWVNELGKMLSPLSCEIIKAIIEIMTYDESLKGRDPALQPFIPLPQDELALAPNLFSGSNNERNLVALLAKIDSDGYTATTDCLEKYQIDNIVRFFKKSNWDSIKNRKLPKGWNLPDIDIAIYDRISRFVLIIEAKWTYPASEASEKFHKAVVEHKGIGQIDAILSFAKRDLKEFFKYCFPAEIFDCNIEIGGCVIMRGFVGTSFNYRQDIPVIEESILEDNIGKIDNLIALYNWMANRSYFPIPDKDFISKEHECRIGPYKIIWNQVSIISI